MSHSRRHLSRTERASTDMKPLCWHGLTILICFAALSVADVNDTLPSAAPTSSFDSHGFLDVLRANNLTTLANLVQANPTHLLHTLGQDSGGNKTLLAPTDAAFGALGVDLPSGADLAQLMAYHVLNGSVRRQDVPRKGYDVEIVPTMMPARANHDGAQVVVLAKASEDADGNGGQVVVREAARNTTFALSDRDGPVFANVLVQPIDQVLSIPSTVSGVGRALNSSSAISMLKVMNLLSVVEEAPSITILAPTEKAVLDSMVNLATTLPQQQITIMRQHIINGTVLYSTQLPARASSDNVDAIQGVVTSAGELLTITNDDGRLRIRNKDVMANVVRTDILLKNGVVHYVDAVFANVASDPRAANEAYSKAVADAQTNLAPPGSPKAGSGLRSSAEIASFMQTSASGHLCVGNSVPLSFITFCVVTILFLALH